MPRRRTTFTIVFLLLMIGGIVAALVVEASRNPSFRAADYEGFADCMANIPREWLPGSLEHTSAETACAYVHAPARTPRR